MDNTLMKFKKYLLSIIFAVGIAITFICDYILKLNSGICVDAVSIVYSSLVSFSAVWITCYLLIAQVFKDRYSFKNVEEEQLLPMEYQMIEIILAVVFGTVLIFVDYGIATSVYYCVFSTAFIIKILLSVRKTVKFMMINTTVNAILLKIGKEFKENGKVSDDLMKDIKDIFKECVIKEEYCVVENIVDNVEGMFGAIVEIETYESYKYEFLKELWKLTFYEEMIILESDRESLKFMLFRHQANILKELVDKEDKKVFMEFYEMLCHHNFEILSHNGDAANSFIRNTYPFLHENVFDYIIEEQRDDVLELAFKELKKCEESIRGLRNGEYTEEYILMINGMLVYYYNCNQRKLPEVVFTLYTAITRKVLSFGNIDMKVCRSYIQMFMMMRDKFIDDAVEIFDTLFDKLRLPYDIKADQSFVGLEKDIFMVLLAEMTKKENVDVKKIIDYRRNIILDCVEAGIERTIPLLGNFDIENISEMQYTIYNLMLDYSLIIKMCISKDRKRIIFSKLFEYERICSKCNDERVKEILYTFFNVLLRSPDLINSDLYYEVLLYVCDLLKSYKIKYRIDVLKDAAITIEDQHIKKCIISIIDEILKRSDECTDDKKEICRKIFCIGVDCIEKGCEKTLERVFNILGWTVLNELSKNPDNKTLSAYVYARVCDLFKFSKKVGVSYRTKVFMLTLFTTLGMYCYDHNNEEYLHQIYRVLKEEGIDDVELAIDLRVSENDDWDDYFDSKNKDKFIAGLLEYKSNSD